MGVTVAMALAEQGHEVTVMDVDVESFRRLPSDSRVTLALGDGTVEDDLRQAGVEGADVFIAVTRRDTRNILIAQMARHVFKIKRVVCGIDDPVRQEVYEGMGLHALSPTKVLAEMIAKDIQQ